jgi:hypothetical protein
MDALKRNEQEGARATRPFLLTERLKGCWIMRLRHFSFCFVWLLQGICAVPGVAVCVGQSEKQAGLSRSPIAVTYQEVLDILFPCQASGEYYLILRFLPSWTSESQIVISRNDLGTYDIDYYYLPSGSKKIAEQVQAMLEQNIPESPQQFASRIRVEHRQIRPAPPALSRLIASYFALRIPPRLQTKSVIDGTKYEFWFVTLSSQNVLHISLDDGNSDQVVRNPVAVWMNRVRRFVETPITDKERRPARTITSRQE